MNKFKDMSSGFLALWASFILSAAWFVFYNVGVYSALVIVSGLIFIYIFPLIYLLNDSTLSKENKSGWLILTIFFSWISFAFYLIKKNNK